jgi:hypothetical protein
MCLEFWGAEHDDLLFRCSLAFHLSSPSLSLWRTHTLRGSVFGEQVGGLSAEQTVYNVYSAKKLAESAPGVGRAPDLILMTRTGRQVLGPDQFKILDEIRENAQRKRPTQADLAGVLPSASAE